MGCVPFNEKNYCIGQFSQFKYQQKEWLLSILIVKTKFFKEFEKWKQKKDKKRKRRGKNTREVKGKKTRFVRRELTSFNLWESIFLSKFQDAITSVQDQSKNPKKCSRLSYKIKAATFNSISSRRKMNELLVECGPTNCVNFQPKSCCGKLIVILTTNFQTLRTICSKRGYLSLNLSSLRSISSHILLHTVISELYLILWVVTLVSPQETIKFKIIRMHTFKNLCALIQP